MEAQIVGSAWSGRAAGWDKPDPTLEDGESTNMLTLCVTPQFSEALISDFSKKKNLINHGFIS